MFKLIALILTPLFATQINHPEIEVALLAMTLTLLSVAAALIAFIPATPTLPVKTKHTH